MIHAIVVLSVVVLCLACAGLVCYVNTPMFTEPRPRYDRPGSAGLPAIDPATLAHLRRRMAGLPAHQRSAPVTAGYALGRVPSWARDGANPYPAETIVDLPAIPAVRPYALSPVRAGCPSSPAGGHCCRNDSGTWTCLVPGCPR